MKISKILPPYYRRFDGPETVVDMLVEQETGTTHIFLAGSASIMLTMEELKEMAMKFKIEVGRVIPTRFVVELNNARWRMARDKIVRKYTGPGDDSPGRRGPATPGQVKHLKSLIEDLKAIRPGSAEDFILDIESLGGFGRLSLAVASGLIDEVKTALDEEVGGGRRRAPKS